MLAGIRRLRAAAVRFGLRRGAAATYSVNKRIRLLSPWAPVLGAPGGSTYMLFSPQSCAGRIRRRHRKLYEVHQSLHSTSFAFNTVCLFAGITKLHELQRGRGHDDHPVETLPGEPLQWQGAIRDVWVRSCLLLYDGIRQTLEASSFCC